MINSEECLHIEGGTILLRNCNSNLKNQQFTLHELKKRKVERRLKDNTKMEIEVEGRDKKIKDKSIHGVLSNYLFSNFEQGFDLLYLV